MSEFTMRLKDVLELERFDERGPSVIGLSSYPIFDDDYRDTLNEKIIRRYYTREIGHESIAMFRHAMNREMHEIMPYYNQLYRSERLTIDPLSTVNLRTLATNDFSAVTDLSATSSATTENEADATVSSTTNNETQAGGESLGMEYPQQQLNEDGRYATTGSKSENASTSSGTGEETQSSTGTTGVDSTQSSNTTNEGDSTGETVQTGWSGSQADLLNRYRETFLNIDVMILDALNPLFMGIWGNGNSHYSDRHMGPWRAWF